MAQDSGSGLGFSVVVRDGLVDCRVHQNLEMQGVYGCNCGHEDCTGYFSMGSPSQDWIENFLQGQVDSGLGLEEAIKEYWRDVQRQLGTE